MPFATVEIRVSRREADRPRLLQASAADGARRPVGGLALLVRVDENGTLADEERVVERRLVTGADGIVLFQWFEWPRNGPARDFVSTVTVEWEDASAAVHVEDLYD